MRRGWRGRRQEKAGNPAAQGHWLRGRLFQAPARAARRPGEGQFVRGLEDVAQHLLGFVHDLDEFRIEMADERRAQGSEHAGMDIAWAGAHQNPRGRGELRYDWNWDGFGWHGKIVTIEGRK